MPPRPNPPRLTHFLCIPLVTSSSRSQLQKAFGVFRDHVTKVRTAENPDGIPEKAIRSLGTLHLTLGVMSLLTQERVDSALKLLGELNLKELLSAQNPMLAKKRVGVNNEKEKPGGEENIVVAGPTSDASGKATIPLSITLRGLSSMHTPSKTSILYSSPVDSDLRLYAFCQTLRELFLAAGLVVEEQRPLLLHATIINTVYVPGVKGRGSGHGKNRVRMTIDARDLLEDFEDFIWMEDARVERVAICRMGAEKAEDGEEAYVVEGEVELPP